MPSNLKGRQRYRPSVILSSQRQTSRHITFYRRAHMSIFLSLSLSHRSYLTSEMIIESIYLSISLTIENMEIQCIQMISSLIVVLEDVAGSINMGACVNSNLELRLVGKVSIGYAGNELDQISYPFLWAPVGEVWAKGVCDVDDTAPLHDMITIIRGAMWRGGWTEARIERRVSWINDRWRWFCFHLQEGGLRAARHVQQ